MAIKRLSTILLLFFACTAFAQSWQSKEAVRIENTESSFHYTFRDSTTLYIQKQNISYIVSLPNSNYIQVGYLYEGATSKIMSCTYNTLTQPALGSNAELADTLNAWLNEPSSGGGGGGVQSVVAGTNITVDNTDPENPIISATDSASSLFPNGVKLVLSSRDFQADDKDFILYCPVPGTIITMPTTNPFSEGDYIGVVMSSPDSYFETYNNGSGGTDKMYPYTANPTGTTLEQQSSSEVVILRALNQGTLWILPLCGAVKESVDINGSNFKTLARYNYDKSQNAIPLSGTVSGSPVTDDIEFEANAYKGLKTLNSNGDAYNSIQMSDGGVLIESKSTPTSSTNIQVVDYEGKCLLITDNTNPVGYSCLVDCTPYITELDYTQKKYVGYRGTATLEDGTVTVNNTYVKTGWKIYVSYETFSGTTGSLKGSTSSIVDGTSFVIESSSILDNSTVNWWIAP
jgi:hypothetical protein